MNSIETTKLASHFKNVTFFGAIWYFMSVDHAFYLYMNLFQSISLLFFQHIRKHTISYRALKTTLSLSYLLAIFLNLIFNPAKNPSIVPLLLYFSSLNLVGPPLFLCFLFLTFTGILLLMTLDLNYFLITRLS